MGWVCCLARVAAAAVAGASLSALRPAAKMKLRPRIVCALEGDQIKPGAELRRARLAGADPHACDRRWAARGWCAKRLGKVEKITLQSESGGC